MAATKGLTDTSQAPAKRIGAAGEARGNGPLTRPARTQSEAAWAEVPIASIEVGERLRAVEEATVANLMVAVEESEFFGTILVRPKSDLEEEAGLFRLVAGAHRLEAMKRLGRPTIPCTIRVLTDDEAELIEIDENLVRRELNPLERGEMVAARLAVWARRFPDRVVQSEAGVTPKRGRPRNVDKMTTLSGVRPAMGFREETAADLGLNEKTIRRALDMMQGLRPGVRAKLRGTWIAKNDGVLRQLAAISDLDEQARVADVLLSGQTKSVSDAIALAAGNTPSKAVQTPSKEAFDAFRSAWKKLNPSQRADALTWLCGQPMPKGVKLQLLERADD